MNRRELLKAILPLGGIPIVAGAVEVGKAFKIEKDAKYEVFINGDSIDPEVFGTTHGSLPAGTPIYTVFPNGSQTLDDAIRIYKL